MTRLSLRELLEIAETDSDKTLTRAISRDRTHYQFVVLPNSEIDWLVRAWQQLSNTKHRTAGDLSIKKVLQRAIFFKWR
jgi:hypothetical protein